MKKTVVKKKEASKPRIPYHFKPDNLTLEEWQKALRKQFGSEKKFSIENVGNHPVFSDYLVTNPETNKTYKVAIRDERSGLNFCSCPDFKTNLLGTCKHVENVLFTLNKKAANKKIFKQGFFPSYSSISVLYGAERKVHLRVGETNSARIIKAATGYFDEAGFLILSQIDQIEKFIHQVSLLDKEFRIYDDAMEYILGIRDKNKRNKVIDTKYSSGKSIESIIRAQLYPYQAEGVKFAARAGRSLIADDMGLGKTIQAIAVSELYFKEKWIEKVLIICPTSLKHQWKSEITKFTGKESLIIQGLPHVRKEMYGYDADYNITSYDAVRNDISRINEAHFDLIILDEAQRIKNWKTKTSQQIKSIDSPYCLVLTGTPLENKIEELFSIMQFVDKFRLGPLYSFIRKHQVTDANGKVVGYEHLNDIQKTLNSVLVRRTKKEIEEQLPDRIDNNYFVSVTQEQKTIHDEWAETVTRIVAKWHKTGFLREEDRQRLLIALNCMRMVSDSTFILDQKTRFDTKIDELKNILSEIFESSNDKVVIFSQWERMTRLVSKELSAMKIKYEYLHGGVPGEKRGNLLENFREQENSRVFLSTDAGGTGLNLQTASIVINLDIPWNPAVLEQRIARVHRLGQKKSVRVINLISTGTIEHRILHLLAFKKAMFAGVLDAGLDSVFLDKNGFSQLMSHIETLTSDSEVTEIAVETSSEKQLDLFSHETSGREALETTDDDVTSSVGQNQNASSGSGNSKTDDDINPIGVLLSQGVELLSELGKMISQNKSQQTATSDQRNALIQTDERTGEKYLKIPLNENNDLVRKLSNGLSAFLNALKNQS